MLTTKICSVALEWFLARILGWGQFSRWSGCQSWPPSVLTLSFPRELPCGALVDNPAHFASAKGRMTVPSVKGFQTAQSPLVK